jgi:hypothetical protein
MHQERVVLLVGEAMAEAIAAQHLRIPINLNALGERGLLVDDQRLGDGGLSGHDTQSLAL